MVDADSLSSEEIILNCELVMANLDSLSSQGTMLDCKLVMTDSAVIALKQCSLPSLSFSTFKI